MTNEFHCGKLDPVVQTKAGKLRGFVTRGTYTFHGIRYAVARRFHAPEPVKPWRGIKDALAYGYVCPLLKQDQPSNEVMIPHRYWPMDENCQYLNIWTQSLDKNAKKPVMVWLHGGGFFAGSSIEQVAYDGENLSRYGDVVVVSLNHRLNILGYLDLSPFGEEYANSANAGNDDMIAALKWIRENIAAFGGDPENVTLFGQSGGGMKVWTLMQMPAADGLFHKGIVQSGLVRGALDCGSGDGTAIVHALMEQLGLKRVKELETVPYALLAQAYQQVAPALLAQGKYVGGNPKANDYFLGDPLAVGFRQHARQIPVMIGTVLGEFSFLPALPEAKKRNPGALDAMMEKRYGSHAAEIRELFRGAYPQKHESDALFVDSLFREPTIDFVEQKSRCPESRTYSYLFSYTFPYDDGHIAWHCSEIPFVFHNVSRVDVCQNGKVTDRLEQQLSDAWLNFARTGDPSSPNLPTWFPCAPGDEACMIFDETCRLVHNHDHELIRLHAAITPGLNQVEEQQSIQH